MGTHRRRSRSSEWSVSEAMKISRSDVIFVIFLGIVLGLYLIGIDTMVK